MYGSWGAPSYDGVSDQSEQSNATLTGPTSSTEVVVTISGEAPGVAQITFQAS
jgi:hypothetical protein